MINPGDVIDRYTVDAVIGHGGTAVVYKVHHTHLGTAHALKILALSHPGIKKRMMREGQVQATLDHPNIVAVTDVFAIDNQPALLMEFVEGPTLETWVAENQRPPLVEAERLFRAVVAGVAHAHAQGLVHRDLKPANVLLAPDDRGWVPKVTDFGLAKVLHQQAGKGQTHAGVAMGTPDYMAPEQIRDAGAVDKRADIFSLGCILYELLCGQGPFAGPDIIQIYNNVASGTYPDPMEKRPDMPSRFLDAIRGCLNSDRDHRISDCETLLDVLAGSPLPAYVSVEGDAPKVDSAEVELDAPPLPGRSLPLDTLSDDETQEAPLEVLPLLPTAPKPDVDAPSLPAHHAPLGALETGPAPMPTPATEDTTAPQGRARTKLTDLSGDDSDDDRTLQLPGKVVARAGESEVETKEPAAPFPPVVSDRPTEKLPEPSFDDSDSYEVANNSSTGLWVLAAMAAVVLLLGAGLLGGSALFLNAQNEPSVPQVATQTPNPSSNAASAEVEQPAPATATTEPEPEPEPEPEQAAEKATTKPRQPSTRVSDNTGRSTRRTPQDEPATSGFETTTRRTREPEPEPEPVAPVTVKLLSVPPSADLQIDGRAFGMTPAKIQLSPGGHTVAMVQGDSERTFRIQVSEEGDTKWCYNFERDSSHTGSCPR